MSQSSEEDSYNSSPEVIPRASEAIKRIARNHPLVKQMAEAVANGESLVEYIPPDGITSNDKAAMIYLQNKGYKCEIKHYFRYSSYYYILCEIV